jgi:hypothetical protein
MITLTNFDPVTEELMQAISLQSSLRALFVSLSHSNMQLEGGLKSVLRNCKQLSVLRLYCSFTETSDHDILDLLTTQPSSITHLILCNFLSLTTDTCIKIMKFNAKNLNRFTVIQCGMTSVDVEEVKRRGVEFGVEVNKAGNEDMNWESEVMEEE